MLVLRFYWRWWQTKKVQCKYRYIKYSHKYRHKYRGKYSWFNHRDVKKVGEETNEIPVNRNPSWSKKGKWGSGRFQAVRGKMKFIAFKGLFMKESQNFLSSPCPLNLFYFVLQINLTAKLPTQVVWCFLLQWFLFATILAGKAFLPIYIVHSKAARPGQLPTTNEINTCKV